MERTVGASLLRAGSYRKSATSCGACFDVGTTGRQVGGSVGCRCRRLVPDQTAGFGHEGKYTDIGDVQSGGHCYLLRHTVENCDGSRYAGWIARAQ